jgi:hypothetical protein
MEDDGLIVENINSDPALKARNSSGLIVIFMVGG